MKTIRITPVLSLARKASEKILPVKMITQGKSKPLVENIFSCQSSLGHEYTGIASLVVLNNIPVFFSRMQKNMEKIASNSIFPLPLLCLSPNNIGFRSLRAKILCVCLLHYWWGGGGCEKGGGWTFKNVFEAWFPRLWKKKLQGHLFHRKGMGIPNFSGFWGTWKIATKWSRRAGLHRALQ